jgi:TonB family protein
MSSDHKERAEPSTDIDLSTSLAGMPDESRRYWLLGSIVVHGAIFLLLLWPRQPEFVKASSILAGNNGTANSHIYWLAPRDQFATDSGEGNGSKDARAKLKQKSELEWRKAARKKSKHTVEVAKAEEDSSSIDRGATHEVPPVGSPFGSLSVGTAFGLEVRPAYPIRGSDPVASFGELPSGFEGDVVVEVTIDEVGNIIDKAVIRSINPVLDSKSLAALANWQFHPATKNGVPIPSKHDVYFHFRGR